VAQYQNVLDQALDYQLASDRNVSIRSSNLSAAAGLSVAKLTTNFQVMQTDTAVLILLETLALASGLYSLLLPSSDRYLLLYNRTFFPLNRIFIRLSQLALEVGTFDCTPKQFIQNLLLNTAIEIAQNLTSPTYPSSLIHNPSAPNSTHEQCHSV
jgi:hypothetical protein